MTERAAAGREGQIALDEAKELGSEIVENEEVAGFLENLETTSGRNGLEVAEDILSGGSTAELPEVAEIAIEAAVEGAAVAAEAVAVAAESGVVPIPPL